MPQPSKEQIQARLKAKFGSNTSRTGGAGSSRRKKFNKKKSDTSTSSTRLQNVIRKNIGCTPIPAIDEVNLFKDDGTVVHFDKPKVQAEISSNTYVITGKNVTKNIQEMMPDILGHLGKNNMDFLNKYINEISALKEQNDDDNDDDEIPELINDFETVSKSEIKTEEEKKEEKKEEKTEEKIDENKQYNNNTEMKLKSDFDINNCNSKKLKEHWNILNSNEQNACKLLILAKQDKLFDLWDNIGVNDNLKKELLLQILKLNGEYPGGIVSYYNNSISLLEKSSKGVNPYDGYVPQVPDGVRLDFNSKEFNEYELIGKNELHKTAFILVAGGLGERLGYSGVKPELASEITSNTSFMEIYCKSILKYETYNNNKNKIEFAIMVSDDTIVKTKELMKKNNNFGLDNSQITWLHQTKNIAIKNIDGEFEVEKNNKYKLLTKPGGHGTVHSLLYLTGTCEKWQKLGIEWIIFLQDTNGVAMRSLPCSLGVSKKCNYAMNTICVPRVAKSAIGAITKLVNKDSDSILTCNVEYNELGALLENTGDKKGDIADESGYSKYPGNTNTLIMKLDIYNNTMKLTKGKVNEFVNPKYKDNNKTEFLKPTRLESMMQDYPKLLSKSDRNKVGFTQLPNWIALEPVKNNLVQAKKKYDTIGFPMSASSGEAGIYYCNRQMLIASNVKISSQTKEKIVFGGIPIRYGARVVLQPSFGCTLEEIKSKIRGNVTISDRSTLIIDGNNIIIENLILDGTLIIKCSGEKTKIHIKNLKVENKGWQFKGIENDSNNINEIYKIRGYILSKMDQHEITFNDNLEHIIE